MQKSHKLTQNHKGLEMKFMIIDTIALLLTIIGAINWGLVGLFRFDLVAWLLGGQTSLLARIVYALVGVAGLWCITLLFRQRKDPE